MTNSIKIAALVCFSFVYIIPLFWFDHIDPAFIPSVIYTEVFYYYIPISCVILTVIFLVLAVYKYFTSKDYKNHVKNHFNRFAYLKIFFTILGGPFILYLLICTQVEPSLKLWTYYKADNEWNGKFELIETSQCGGEYEWNCIRIGVQEIGSDTTERFRWYGYRNELSNLQGRLIFLSGKENVFGKNVDKISW